MGGHNVPPLPRFWYFRKRPGPSRVKCFEFMKLEIKCLKCIYGAGDQVYKNYRKLCLAYQETLHWARDMGEITGKDFFNLLEKSFNSVLSLFKILFLRFSHKKI